MYYAIGSIRFLNHVLVVLCIVDIILCSDDAENVVQILGPRIIPEHSELTLECRVSDDFQNNSMNWFFSENMSPINTNKYQSSASGKSTIQMKNVLRQQTNIYYCCLDDSTTICASHSVIVLYTTFDRQIIPINETSGVLILTHSSDDVHDQFGSIDFALCVRYRWQFENVDIVSESGTENPHNDTAEKRSDRSLLWKLLYYNVEFNSRTESRLFEVQYSNDESEATYYLYVFLNGKPKPKMNDILMLPNTGFIALSCWGTAIPAPKVTFSFTPCPSLEWNNCKNAPVTLDEITSTGSHSSITFNESTQVIGSTLASGIVHCKATNSEGTSWTHSKLTQHSQLESIIFQRLPPNTTIYVGDSITVQCSADRYHFTNRFTFHVNYQHEEVLGSLQDNFNWVANFTINNVTTLDNRVVCETLHQNGTLIRETLALNIVQPYIDAQHTSRHLTAKPDTQMLLTCDVTGRPMPQYRWIKNGTELPYTNFMMVASVSGNDKFECIAWNRAGVMSMTWMISNDSSIRMASVEFICRCAIAIALLLLVIMGAVFCYSRTKELCILFRLYKVIRTR